MKPKKYLCKYFEILFFLLTFVKYFNICEFSCYSHFVVGLELLVAIPQKHTQGEAKLEAWDFLKGTQLASIWWEIARNWGATLSFMFTYLLDQWYKSVLNEQN